MPTHHSGSARDWPGTRSRVMLLARLAVDLAWQGRGLGKALVKDALLRTAAAADIAGIRALLVHAKDDEVRGWYEALGVRNRAPLIPITCSCS